MSQKLANLAAMLAVTALSVIRHNNDRHVPGTATETFETDPGTAEHLVASGAARYTVDPVEAAQAAAAQELAGLAAAEDAAAVRVAADNEAADRAVADQATADPAVAEQVTAAAKAAPAKTAAKKR